MAEPSGTPLPEIDDVSSAISRVRARHHERARPLKKSVTAVISAISQPIFLAALIAAVVSWICLNFLLAVVHLRVLDAPPFGYLSCVASVGALFLTVMILTTQKHEDDLAAYRDQLSLELAILTDRRSAKIISLLEDFRRNDPAQSSHPDPEAEAMTRPADTDAVLERIRATHPALRDEPE
jgi:uncharacterized membrane protein